MATINGTQFQDTIHMAGDGVSVGGTEFSNVTTGADTINAGAGNDAIYSNAGADTIDAGTGDDYIDGGADNDKVIAGDGNDTILGGQGADNLSGGIGNDTFLIRVASDVSGLAETINGGSDFDTLDFSTLGAVGSINLAAATITGVERLFLNTNVMTMTAAQIGAFEIIQAGGNVDRIIMSAAGTVDLTGALVQGIDEFRGTAGVDTFILTGVADGQTVNGLAGNDTVTGGSGNDVFNGGVGDDRITASLGNDTLIGEDGIDRLYGEDGNDFLVGGVGADLLGGAAGNDTFRVSVVADVSGLAEVMSGGNDIDRLDFQFYNAQGAVNLTSATISSVEELYVSGNDVTLTAAQLGAFTTLVGGGAFDRLILSAAGTADLTGAAIAGIDEIRGSSGVDVINITDVLNGQFIDGRAGNDTLTGGIGNDTIYGDIGTDTIKGADGNDLIRGGQDADTLLGGVGYDTFQIQQVSDISGLAETIDGGNDVDRLDFSFQGAFGSVNLTTVTMTSLEQIALAGNTVTLTAAQLGAFTGIFGSGSPDQFIISAAGTVDLSNATIGGIDEFRGTAGNDTFTFAGVANGQIVNGLGGTDTITGSEGWDTIDGGAANDTLVGGGGNDRLIGNLGLDTMTGGDGGDIFDFNTIQESPTGAGRDVIVDFVSGQDVIDLVDIDADFTEIGNQGFVFIGSGAFTAAGQLRYAGGILQANVDNNLAADFEVQLTGSPSLQGGDIFA